MTPSPPLRAVGGRRGVGFPRWILLVCAKRCGEWEGGGGRGGGRGEEQGEEEGVEKRGGRGGGRAEGGEEREMRL